MAAVPNYHQINGSQRHGFIKPQKSNMVSLSSNLGVDGAVLLLEARGESLLPFLFQLLEAPTFLGLWLLPLSSEPETVGHVLCISHHPDLLWSHLSLTLSLLTLSSTWVIQDALPIWRPAGQQPQFHLHP